jgi:predicted PurR-regulated permease PerM
MESNEAPDKVIADDGVSERPPRGEQDARPRPITLFRNGAYVSLGVLAVITAAAAVYTVRGVQIQVLIALFVAISLDPAVRMLTRRGVRRGLAVLLIFMVALGLVAAFLVAVIPALVHQFQVLLHTFPDYLAQLQDRSSRFRQLSDRFHMTSQIETFLASLPGRLGNGLLGLTGRLFGALVSTLTVVVLTIYFMLDQVGAYMIGSIVIALLAGTSAFIVFTVLGVPYAVPLAIVVAVCDLIPMIGATLGAVVGVLVTLLATELWPTSVIVAGFFLVYQQLENYLIVPRIQRSTVSLSAAAVLLAALIGGTALGLLGAVMAIPVAAAMRVVITERLQARDAAGTDGSQDSGTAERAESADQQAPELEAANDAPAVPRPPGPKGG